METAIEVFTESGYDRTSFREIARRAGLSQAGLLHYFKTKEDLFLEVLRRRDERNGVFYNETAAHDVTLEGLIDIIGHNALEPGLVRLYVAMSAESTDPESSSRQFFMERYEKLREDIAADIVRKQGGESLDPSLDAHGLATLFIAVADGLQIQWLLNREQVDMGARLDQLNAILGTRRQARPADATP
ncbi:TetR/AcrR family transcriptional regulator [Parafrigoribacterium soli]|uniref:TetR/AcrR family transcriptional regulator n=1 Tax=Parafrigoribacterium soli TaxID=3144663 RepID=UPI0032EB7E1D